jgi:starch phosphorylase
LNCSVLDGWWAEGYDPSLGWAIGDSEVHSTVDHSVKEQDAADAERLYTLLESEIIPEFYDRDASNVPQAWTTRVRESMARLTPQYSANRCVREYTEHHYIPAAIAYHARAANNGVFMKQLTAQKHALDVAWPNLRMGPTTITTSDKSHTFTAPINLAGLDPRAVLVELFADSTTQHEAPFRVTMQRASAPNPANNSPDTTTYTAQASASRPAADFTIRLTPRCDGLSIPLEDDHILWQR